MNNLPPLTKSRELHDTILACSTSWLLPRSGQINCSVTSACNWYAGFNSSANQLRNWYTALWDPANVSDTPATKPFSAAQQPIRRDISVALRRDWAINSTTSYAANNTWHFFLSLCVFYCWKRHLENAQCHIFLWIKPQLQFTQSTVEC